MHKAIIGVLLIALVGVGIYIYTQDEKEGENGPITIESEQLDFAEVGTFVVNNPGQEPGVPYFIYEEPGAPALSKRLVFDERSICVSGAQSMPCIVMSVSFEEAFSEKRGTLSGISQEGDTLIVRKLHALEENEVARVAEPTTPFISWNTAKELLNACEVRMITQTHALDVYLTLNDERVFWAVEPSIDDVFDAVQNVPDACGDIIQATE